MPSRAAGGLLDVVIQRGEKGRDGTGGLLLVRGRRKQGGGAPEAGWGVGEMLRIAFANGRCHEGGKKEKEKRYKLPSQHGVEPGAPGNQHPQSEKQVFFCIPIL